MRPPVLKMDPFQILPIELFVYILTHLTPQELHSIKLINKTFATSVRTCIQYVHRGQFHYMKPGTVYFRKDFLGLLSRLPRESLVFPHKETFIMFISESTEDPSICHIHGRGICIQEHLTPSSINGETFLMDLKSMNKKVFTKNHNYRMYISARKPQREPTRLRADDLIDFIKIIGFVLEIDKVESPGALVHFRNGCMDYVSQEESNFVITI